MSAPAEVIEAYLAEVGLPLERSSDGSYVVQVPGEHRLRTTVSLTVGRHALTLVAFVARRPDEAHDEVHRWLLERNRALYGMAFCLDPLGDIYLVGRTPLAAVSAEEIDRLLGCVTEYADESFNPILERGFRTAIRREWAWRLDRGESTANLAAFAHLAAAEDERPGGPSGRIAP